MKKFIIATLCCSMNSLASATETIRFATEASYPPFEFMDANNQMVGFDIDLANALCKDIQLHCTFSNQAFDSLIPGLKFKHFDAVIAGMDITPERLLQVAFTIPYYDNSALFITQKDHVSNLNDLKGKRVGIQNGTTHQKYLTEKHPDITSVPYDSYQNAILDLKNGRLEAVFGDTAVIHEWLKNNPNLSALKEKITDPNYFGTGLGIAVRQTDTKLLNQFNQTLNKIKQDGTYQTIYNKWFQQ